MIARDRELLARLIQFNTQLGKFTVEMLERQDGGELPADGVRALADYLGPLADDLRARAAELEAVVIDAAT